MVRAWPLSAASRPIPPRPFKPGAAPLLPKPLRRRCIAAPPPPHGSLTCRCTGAYKIGDLGLATATATWDEQEGDACYLSRDLLDSNPSTKADIFSFGIMLCSSPHPDLHMLLLITYPNSARLAAGSRSCLETRSLALAISGTCYALVAYPPPARARRLSEHSSPQ